MTGRDRTTLTAAEIAFLTAQTLGRIATVAPDGHPQNNPVSCYYNPATGTIDIGGHAMSNSRKYRNVQTNPHVALVVDDMPGADPTRIRCLEVRGTAHAIPDPTDSAARSPGPVIRVHPRRILSWGVGPAQPADLAATQPTPAANVCRDGGLGLDTPVTAPHDGRAGAKQ